MREIPTPVLRYDACLPRVFYSMKMFSSLMDQQLHGRVRVFKRGILSSAKRHQLSWYLVSVALP